MRTARTIFVTGTDTGVGKTVLTAMLTRHLRAHGVHALAVKPFCSGGRDDARALCAAQDSELAVDEVNPWHFRPPLTPLLAARREGRIVHLDKVLAWLRPLARRCEVLLVEGAGGVLSPLGEGFDATNLIAATHAVPVVVGINRLGVIHQVRAAMRALPPAAARRALVVLRSPGRRVLAARTNAAMIAEFIGRDRVVEFPRIKRPARPGRTAIAVLEWLRLRTSNLP